MDTNRNQLLFPPLASLPLFDDEKQKSEMYHRRNINSIGIRSFGVECVWISIKIFFISSSDGKTRARLEIKKTKHGYTERTH